MSVRLFLVDDHDLVRAGLRAFMDAEPDLEVVGEAGTAAEAVALVTAAEPDVVLLDLRLPDGDGVEVCREIRSRLPGANVLMLTTFADDGALLDSILAGASGYTLKTARREELLADIRSVAEGRSLISPDLTASLFARLRRREAAHGDTEALTAQERRVLDLIGEGLTNRQIGERLFLAEQTVKNYVSSVLGKLGLRHRTEAALYLARLESGS